MNNPVVYDKAKYHRESVELAGLDEEQAEVHTAFFLGWLIDNDLVSDEMRDECGELLADYKSRKKTAIDVYGWWDCCLIDDMLSAEGNAFAQAYFDFKNGQYLTDYGELPYHVNFTSHIPGRTTKSFGCRSIDGTLIGIKSEVVYD